MKRTSISNIRQNNLISSSSYIDDQPVLHIFGRTHDDKDQKELLDALDRQGRTFNFKTNLDDFNDFDKKQTKVRDIAILITSVLDMNDIKKHIDRRRTERDLTVRDKTTFYTFPHQLPSLGLKNLPKV